MPDTPTPEPPVGNPLLDAAGIAYDAKDYDMPNDTATTTVPTKKMSYGPAPLPKETSPGKIIPMPQRKVI